MNMKSVRILALLATSAVAACQTYSGPTVVEPPRLQGIDGEWVDTRGINTAKFANGVFTSVAVDTGQTMARGSYNYTDAAQQNVNLAFTSLLRNTTVNAACIAVMPSQLNCTTSSGAKFTLVRKSSVPGAAPVAAAPVSPNPPGVPADAVLVQ